MFLHFTVCFIVLHIYLVLIQNLCGGGIMVRSTLNVLKCQRFVLRTLIEPYFCHVPGSPHPPFSPLIVIHRVSRRRRHLRVRTQGTWLVQSSNLKSRSAVERIYMKKCFMSQSQFIHNFF